MNSIQNPVATKVVENTVPFTPIDIKQETFTGGMYITGQDIVDMAKYIISNRMSFGELFNSPQASKEYALVSCADHECEHFSVLLLNSKHRLIEHQFLFRGSIDSTTIHPREVVIEALNKNASAVIFIHNHPSGDPTPSLADEKITERLVCALRIVNIKVLDHLVVGATEVVSLAELGKV